MDIEISYYRRSSESAESGMHAYVYMYTIVVYLFKSCNM